jgi:hypothetical protein
LRLPPPIQRIRRKGTPPPRYGTRLPPDGQRNSGEGERTRCAFQ